MASPNNIQRPPSRVPCIYWDGLACSAIRYFSAGDISCYNDGNCDGHGTCRECSKFDRGGLKLDSEDGIGGLTQTPINLEVYNIRAKIQTCCNWQGAVIEFTRKISSAEIQTEFRSYDLTQKILFVEDTSSFPNQGSLVATKTASPTVYITYNGKLGDRFLNATLSPEGLPLEDYIISFPKRSLFPILIPNNGVPRNTTEIKSRCSIDAARPWQEPFTEENPTAYGCNGAKAECDFYTGPNFTEVIDAKMDKGDRVSAKQIMELRYYSDKWEDYADPQAVWDSRFDQPEIWAYGGSLDTEAIPRMQRVSILNLNSGRFQTLVDPPVSSTTGTPIDGGPPDYPTLIRELSSLDTGLKIIWPRGTSVADPYVKKVFLNSDRIFPILVKVNGEKPAIAINLTKHPQGNTPDIEFINSVKATNPEDVVIASDIPDVPGQAFLNTLEFAPNEQGINHIKFFLEKTDGSGKYLTAEAYIQLKFYYGHVAQTRFVDHYGHTSIDPWIDHFNRLEIQSEYLDITRNSKINSVFWNTIAANGKKSLYAIEEVITHSSSNSDTGDISWEPVECGFLVLTFNNININRVAPWKAWGETGQGEALYVRVNRATNSDLASEEPRLVEYRLAYSSTDGSQLPGNVAMFRPINAEHVRPIDPIKDTLEVKYAYTAYKQGPIAEGDILKLKYPGDTTKVITHFPYEITTTLEGNTIIEGPFVRVGSRKVYSCEEIIGDCYTAASTENERQTRNSFLNGGLSDGELFTPFQMADKCIEDFNSSVGGEFLQDGTPASFSAVVAKLKNKYLDEGTQHYTFLIEDEDGRVIGRKEVDFLTQSAVAQTRDVEIRYKWESQIRYYSQEGRLFMHATFATPMEASTENLPYLSIIYDPECGDHFEAQAGGLNFELEKVRHGAVWYPYKNCLQSVYHADNSRFDNPYPYSTIVEGFDSGLRRNYWERARVWDQYMPVVMNYWGQPGCFWTEWDANLNAYAPHNFAGYTKIRSNHLKGPYSTDRESIRISRHQEKRNLAVKDETFNQSGDVLTQEITEEFEDLLYDSNGQLRSGEEAAYPIWVHMDDSLSVVKPTAEETEHPFTHLLMVRCGSHEFAEMFSEDRVALADVIEEKDLTTTEQRLTDGTLPYEGEETTVNQEDGQPETEVGRDIRWVYREPNTSWAWLAEPPKPVRGGTPITGLFISNPSSALFKKDLEPATYTTEETHTIQYSAPVFDDTSGEITSPATLTLDGGPPLNISFTTGELVVFGTDPSPYIKEDHEGEDYEFVLFGSGSDGFGILADNQGIQRFEVSGNKLATLAGVSINTLFDINELPYSLSEVSTVGRIRFSCSFGSTISTNIETITRTYLATEGAKLVMDFDFRGHYFVERIELAFSYGGDVDIPTIKGEGNRHPDLAIIDLFDTTSYISGDGVDLENEYSTTLFINQRLHKMKISLGARQANKGMNFTEFRVYVRIPEDRAEAIFTYAPKIQISTANTGTHKPSQLTYYFRRTFWDFAESFLYRNTQHMFGRTIKDVIPQYEFHDPLNERFPYENIDFTTIPGYVENSLGFKYLSGQIAVCSKSYTMYTTDHQEDPGFDLNHSNSFDGFAFEGLQEQLYQNAADLLGDKITIFSGFWHPSEIEFFSRAGINLEDFSWQLEMRSELASLDKVFKDENYGCDKNSTDEYRDGKVHPIENWQAKGAWFYLCDPKYNWTCLAVLMNKCVKYLMDLYGTSEYVDGDITTKYAYVMTFPPNEVGSYILAGLVDKPTSYYGGIWAGFHPTSAIQAAYSVRLTGYGGPFDTSPHEPVGKNNQYV